MACGLAPCSALLFCVLCRAVLCRPRAGLLVFCVLNISSPLLHLSKLASTLEMKRTKTLVFAGFALVFFLTRVLLFPYVIVKA
jgi:ceramide synthetase